MEDLRTPSKPTASANWGKGYFGINKPGHVTVHPDKNPEQAIDLKELVDQLQARGIQLPILLRFTDILRHRVGEIHDAFQDRHRASTSYQGNYCCVYPIKVNQQRHVVEEILDFGKPLQLRPGGRLQAGAARRAGPDQRRRHADHLQRLQGRRVHQDDRAGPQDRQARSSRSSRSSPSWRRSSSYAEELNVRPVHRRARQAGGARRGPLAVLAPAIRSKFGLTLTEVLEALEYLKQRGMADCLQLVHFHLGSQITNIRNIKNALTEAARVYVELHRVGAGVKYLDVGGGLGIDYDGSQTDFESSVNYTLQEYANDVVFRIKSVCDEAGVPHPTIISESGRAVVAYHSVLVFDVLGVSNFDRYQVPPEIPADAPQPVTDLFGIYRDLSKKNFLESYHDAVQADGRGAEPVQPRLPVHRAAGPGRAALLGRRAARSCSIVRELDYVPEELQGLESLLSDTYFCNFSVFQSMPD